MTRRKKIKLTIAIPTYNRHAYLDKLLTNIINLDLRDDCEVLVINNNSTDSTANILSKYKNNSKFTIDTNDFNLGIEGNIIRALTTASGEYIWLLSDHMNINIEAANNLLNKTRNNYSFDIGYARIANYESILEKEESIELNKLSDLQKSLLIFCTSNISGLVVRSALIQKSIRSVYRMSRYTYPHLGIYFDLNSSSKIIEFNSCSSFQDCRESDYTISYNTFVSRFIEYPKLLADLGYENKNFRITGNETKIKAYTSALNTELLKISINNSKTISMHELSDALKIYNIFYKLIFTLIWLLNFVPLLHRRNIIHNFIKIFYKSKLTLFHSEKQKQ